MAHNSQVTSSKEIKEDQGRDLKADLFSIPHSITIYERTHCPPFETEIKKVATSSLTDSCLAIFAVLFMITCLGKGTTHNELNTPT